MSLHFSAAAGAAFIVTLGSLTSNAQTARKTSSTPGNTVAAKAAIAKPVTASPATSFKAIGPPPGDLKPQDGEHPLAPLIRWGKEGVVALEKLDCYSCKLVKRERVNGKLGKHESMALKVDHRPLSIYLGFLRREGKPWQEAVYVDGANNGKMYVHSDAYKVMGTVAIYPDSDRALRDSRYPITEVGILNLIKRLVEHAESDSRFGDCEVKIYPGAKIEGRPCLYVRVTHTKERPEFTFHTARIFIDNELNVPVRYEAFGFPTEAGGEPPLLEEYTYLNFQFNPAFGPQEFNIRNPKYHFPAESSEPPPADAVRRTERPVASDR